MPREIPFSEIASADFHVDAVYKGGTAGNIGDDPSTKMLPIGNAGGFRISGPTSAPRLVALFTSGDEGEWPDSIDPFTGLVRYYGDNRTPGNDLHDTKKRGNEILRRAFELRHGNEESRKQAPIFLLFSKGDTGYDKVFRGLIVPGASSHSSDDDLVAIWRTKDGSRFQNYKATFTVLDAPTVSKAWLLDVIAGKDALLNAPDAYREWVLVRRYIPLLAPKVDLTRTKTQQLPDTKPKMKLLKHIHQKFQNNPHGFERIALEIWALSSENHVVAEVTRKSRDGGRDAIGKMFLGPHGDQLGFDFVLEAKCYEPGKNGVGVRETARLISRLRGSTFGVMVTTSYVAEQAYTEAREDEQPLIIISGGDIIDILFDKGYSKMEQIDLWINSLT